MIWELFTLDEGIASMAVEVIEVFDFDKVKASVFYVLKQSDDLVVGNCSTGS